MPIKSMQVSQVHSEVESQVVSIIGATDSKKQPLTKQAREKGD